MRIGVSNPAARGWRRIKRLSMLAQQRARSGPIRIWHRGRGVPIPPARLIHLVGGSEDVVWFLKSGRVAADSLLTILEMNGLRLEQCGRVLDFGCGVGRVLRHWSGIEGVEFWGTDYNALPIDWCRRHLRFAHFQVNELGRPLDFDDGSFDLIYAFSVFTHLSAARQVFWMRELDRILKPGGHLLLSLHGNAYREQLDDAARGQFDSGQLVVADPSNEGSNDCSAFHPESHVRSTLAKGWDVLDFVPEGARGNPRQDAWLLRKPAATIPPALAS